MKALVVGGSGFIGRNFLLGAKEGWKYYATYNFSTDFEDFLEDNCLDSVVPIKVDTEDTADVCRKLGSFEDTFDVCLYALGNSDIGLSSRTPMLDIKSNVLSLINVLETIKVKKFIFISSGAVYEGYKGLVCPSMPVNPTIPYAISKLASEKYIEYFQKRRGKIDSYINLRFFGAYGPMELGRKIYTILVNKFCFEKSSEFDMAGDGKNYIDAMYIDDAIAGIYKMMESDKGNLTIDYCFGSPLTINELIYESAKVFGIEASITHNGLASEYTTFYASPLPVEALFGFRPSIDLKTGLLSFGKYLEGVCQS